MEIISFDQLTQADATTQATVPYVRDDAIRIIQEKIAVVDLSPDVPDEVRRHFERSRTIFVYGYFNYEFFTAAAHHALLTAELALRQRLTEAFPARDTEFENATFSPLQRAAEQAGLLLDDQREIVHPIRRLRNTVAHPTYTMTITPPAAADLITVIADLINHLWRKDGA